MATIEQLQESLDNRSLDPNTLSPKQRKIIDELIRRKKLTGPTMSDLSSQRDVAAKKIASENEKNKNCIVVFKLKNIDRLFYLCYIVAKGNSILPPGKRISH